MFTISWDIGLNRFGLSVYGTTYGLRRGSVFAKKNADGIPAQIYSNRGQEITTRELCGHQNFSPIISTFSDCHWLGRGSNFTAQYNLRQRRACTMGPFLRAHWSELVKDNLACSPMQFFPEILSYFRQRLPMTYPSFQENVLIFIIWPAPRSLEKQVLSSIKRNNH